MPKRWQVSDLALTLCAAQMALHLGAPKVLSETQFVFFPGPTKLKLQLLCKTIEELLRLDIADLVVQTNYKKHARVMPLGFSLFAKIPL